LPQTLGALLQERATAIAGRVRERALLRGLFDDGGPVVGYVHGLAGVGKSTLLHALAAEARAAGAATIELDAHALYPTEGAVLAAVAGTASEPRAAANGAGGPTSTGAAPPTLETAAAAVGARGDRVVLLIDSYELLLLLDRWMCETFVPALPAQVRVVLAGRDAPAERWRAYGALLESVALANLPPDDAVALLRRNGVDGPTARGINSVARGHPLSLQLAAGALRDRPGLPLEEIAAGAVGGELARVYLDGLDRQTRRALDAAALTRRTTISLLEAMLPDTPATDAFERLRALPFVELGADGLVVHDTVREACAAVLRASNPQEYWRLRAAAWSRLRTELRGAPRRDLWRYTADMLYLIEEQAVREAFFPAAVGEQAVERATPADLPALERLANPELVRAWFDAVPEAFLVARGEGGSVEGFVCLTEPHAVSPRLLDRDRLAGAWRAHLRSDPPPRGQKTLFLRWLRGTEVAGGALLLDITRSYMELRPELRRVYAAARDFLVADSTCALVMGYLPLEGHPDSVCVDFGPASVDGWLAELGERELRVEPAAGLEAAGRRLVLDGREIELTRLEAEVLGYLRRREGEPVERAELLRDVWGYDWTGGSNVVEVVVSALRRKLGDRAVALETVRGVGYRLRSDLS
jgi:Transcriptional regulatory protein, C terminal